MKRNNTEIGMAHIVIIATLFLLLMATLGVVFYQNFIARKLDTGTQKQPTSSLSPDITKRAQVAVNSTIYEMDYPKTWTAATEKIEKSRMGGSVTKITNGNKTIEVMLSISEFGVDQSCEVTDGLKISYYKVYDSKVTKLTDMPLYLVETMSDNVGGGYQYKIGLTPDGGDTHTAIGESHCNVVHVGHASSVVLAADSQIIARPAIIASINFPKLPAPPKSAARDMQAIKDLLNTDDYKAAVKILESARKK